eukprot:scaffold21204_cov51-Prasinocladus_malaysianus.AAC.2
MKLNLCAHQALSRPSAGPIRRVGAICDRSKATRVSSRPAAQFGLTSPRCNSDEVRCHHRWRMASASSRIASESERSQDEADKVTYGDDEGDARDDKRDDERDGKDKSFEATGFDIYSFYDQNYSVFPRKKSGHTLIDDLDRKSLDTWTYVDPDESLPADYQYASCKGEAIKEVVLLQGGAQTSINVSPKNVCRTLTDRPKLSVRNAGFHWDSWKQGGGWYNYLSGYVDEIKSLGITHIWLPPPSQSVSAE